MSIREAAWVTLVLYVLVSTLAGGVVPAAEIVRSSSPLGTVLGEAWGVDAGDINLDGDIDIFIQSYLKAKASGTLGQGGGAED